jgi:gliding motility-associated-like protein
MRFLYTLILTVLSLAAFSATNITSDKPAGCPPLLVNFADQSTITPTTWKWNFGNGNTSIDSTPSAEFINSGIYQVTLVVSNGIETDTVVKTITVYKLPVVNFNASTSRTCLNDTIEFLSNITIGSAPITQYAWGFGNGVASSEPVATYFYNHIGAYTITLVVQDSNGCTANLSKPSFIHVYNPPVAAFIASPTSSCQIKQLVNFTNQSTGGGLSYFWQLDNNTTSTSADPSNIYPTEVATAILTVTDSNGCTSSASQKISVGPLTADFIASKTKACTGQPISFINSSSVQGTSWFWNFGDGTTATSSSASKAYSAPGIYTVTFVVSMPGCADSLTRQNYITIKQGLSPSTVSFTADSTFTCGTPLNALFTNTTPTDPSDTYHWSFGNGDTSDAENPSSMFTTPGNYTVVLTITDTNGCVITGTKSDMIQTARPVADFSVDSTACLGSTITFANKSTNAGIFMWLFGDGDTSFVTSPSHQYAAAGTYTVTLFAYSRAGCDTSVVKTNCVTVSYVHVDFKVNSTFSPCPPFVCLFTNQSDAKVNKFQWNFGDGYTDTAANPTHIYFYPGVYTVTLTGHTPQGCYDTIVYPNLIIVQGPTGTFTLTPITGCIPLSVNISALPSANTQNIWCDMGDGTVVNDTLTISHVYTQARIYHPQFVLTDHVGCTVSYPLDSVIAYPVPVLTVSDTTVCPGTRVTLTVASNVSEINWSPDTLLSCANCATVSLTPTDSIVYQVVATNQYGCQAAAPVHVNVVPFPILNDSVSARLCAGDTKALYVGNANNITWSPGLYLSDSTIANPVCTPMDSVTYTVTASNSIGCKVSAQVPVAVGKKVSVALPAEVKVCTDGSVNLPVSAIFISDLGATYLWNNPQYLNDIYSSDPLASVKRNTMDFMVVVRSGHCIPDTQTVVVDVVATPDIEVSTTVSTTPDAGVPLYAASHQELNYQWFAKDSFSCADCRRTILYPKETQTVYVEGTNSTGCSVRDSVQIDVLGCDPGTIFIPNTFTPNGDGLNDVLYVRTMTLSSLKFFRVFDEWGQMVFETNNLQQGWDGNVNSKQAATSVYVYELEGTCQNGYDVRKTGNVTAIR